MFCLRNSVTLSFLLCISACTDNGDTLGRVVDMWSSETIEIAKPAMSDALVIAGMAVELCAMEESEPWSAWIAGDSMGLSEGLNSALGEPVIQETSILGEDRVLVSLDGVVVMDRSAARMRFIADFGDTGMQLEALVMDARVSEEEQLSGEPFGRLLLEVEDGCALGSSLVRGSAHWTDLEARTHTIRLPSDDVFGSGVIFEPVTPWLPVTGTMSWSARIGSQERTIVTFDAGDMVIEDEGGDDGTLSARWPSVIGGPDWIAQDAVEISPGI